MRQVKTYFSSRIVCCARTALHENAIVNVLLLEMCWLVCMGWLGEYDQKVHNALFDLNVLPGEMKMFDFRKARLSLERLY